MRDKLVSCGGLEMRDKLLFLCVATTFLTGFSVRSWTNYTKIRDFPDLPKEVREVVPIIIHESFL